MNGHKGLRKWVLNDGKDRVGLERYDNTNIDKGPGNGCGRGHGHGRGQGGQRWRRGMVEETGGGVCVVVQFYNAY